MGKNVFLALDVKSDVDALRRSLAKIPGGVNRATSRAVNRTLTTLRAEGTRIAAEAYTAKSSSFRKDIRIRKATYRDPNGRIAFVSGQGRPLFSFKVKPSKRPNWKGVPVAKRRPWDGVSAMINRGGMYKVRQGKDGQKTFIATTRQGTTGVFYRLKTPGARGGKLGMAFGPGPVLALMRHQSQERLDNTAVSAMKKNLSHELSAILKGYTK